MLVFGAIRTDTAPCGRYIQLPVNLGMPEAWQGSGHTWPSVGEGAPGNGSILEAAAHLGVGVFASAPLQEGQLLQDTSLRVSVSRTTLIRFKPRLQLRLVCVLTAPAGAYARPCMPACVSVIVGQHPSWLHSLQHTGIQTTRDADRLVMTSSLTADRMLRRTIWTRSLSCSTSASLRPSCCRWPGAPPWSQPQSWATKRPPMCRPTLRSARRPSSGQTSGLRLQPDCACRALIETPPGGFASLQQANLLVPALAA